MKDEKEVINNLINQKYKYGFSQELDQDIFPKGLSEDVIKKISLLRQEPDFILQFRLEAYKYLQTLPLPQWAHLKLPHIDLQQFSYYASLKSQNKPNSLDEVDPKIIEMFNKLNIPLYEQKILTGVSTEIVIDSNSVFTTFKKNLEGYGVIFCSISEAIQTHPNLIKKYLGTVVSQYDNYFACLNAAVFSDGSFIYVPKGVKCPVSISTYFRMNALDTGQFERTLIIADENSSVEYLEGCTAPAYKTSQMHAAVVELIAEPNAHIHYSTVQNWYAGNNIGEGGVLNFVTKRGLALKDAQISWTQIENGATITWKYPSVILKGDNSKGEYHSVAITKNYQQADTGTKMIHLGKNTHSIINVKSIAAGHSNNSYRGLVHMHKGAIGASNRSNCHSLLIGQHAFTNTFPYMVSNESLSSIEHEATTSKISLLQLLYAYQRGLSERQAYSIIVTGFCRNVFSKLPLEFAIEAQKLIELSLEDAIG